MGRRGDEDGPSVESFDGMVAAFCAGSRACRVPFYDLHADALKSEDQSDDAADPGSRTATTWTRLSTASAAASIRNPLCGAARRKALRRAKKNSGPELILRPFGGLSGAILRAADSGFNDLVIDAALLPGR